MTNIFIRVIKGFLLRSYTKLYGFFHHIEKKILFTSFSGKQYSDNPRAICEKMHELYPDFKLVWILKDSDNVYGLIPEYVHVASPGKLSFYHELATSCCYVTNGPMGANISKRKGQYFVQTWHGDRGFKRVLYESNRADQFKVRVFDDSVTDLCVAASNYGINVYKDAFHYHGKILCDGMPRNDKLLSPSASDVVAIKERLGINSGLKIMLYAPTYRDQHGKQSVSFDLDSVLGALESSGDKWICLLRAHTLSDGLCVTDDLESRVIDVTDYPDMADLLLISDFLITDYSSCAGDFILKERPLILFIPDIKEYQEKSRMFKVFPDEVGFITARSNLELINTILETSSEKYVASCRCANEFYGTNESGHAAESICRMIHEHVQL